ncbi:NAD(P)H-dependent flavin oxidoreductase [Novosphingobium taihuense]|uniref:Nitronate monooxygenase n=1 Tax=Novosphingobium taihuense TaxID=260085 RepID=A0A7W7AEA2_9SPHN|nr:nitronate monooxygenase [Novosphingobium taihuense]MBB4615414.1 nitronate monooxygenase [Novosphingobium taihuense]TWH82138.1 nitronate monooxygenase [Novosphingobium taihuense]
MALDPSLRDRFILPAVCAPMFLVSNTAMVKAACKAGIMGALPRQNARSFEIFEDWLKDIRADLDAFHEANPDARIGPLAVNLATKLPGAEMDRHIKLCRQYGVDVIISATGNPAELARCVHDNGLKIFHDVVSFRFAEKAIEAGCDGLTCVGSGGGGHSGNIGHLVLVPRIRRIFDGTLLMAGSISTGAAIRAAEILGADLAYMGTRFIATQEAGVDPAYAAMLVEGKSEDLLFTPKIAGVAANWLVPSIERVGLDPKNLPVPQTRSMSHDHLPEGVKPWKNLWSAGQGIDMIDDLPTIDELVLRLRREYVAACETPSFASVARLVDQALDAAE